MYWFHFSSDLLMPLFSLLGLLLIYFGFRTIRRHRYRKRHWIRTKGQIVDAHIEVDVDVVPFDRDDPVDTSYTRQLKVRFYTTSGQAVEFWNPYSTNLSFNRVGSKINVLYNPANPRDARIAGGVNGAGCLAFSLFLIGIPFALSGAFVILKFFF
ncbi:DUF3592 domain-containing protein [Paenibacillus kribbensis]|uniref:DUF3592 domain-containing protein n=1 Tax=Paenibacillus kribbensis TaxID=172713 RepID=A0A222WHG1_9BACL|nr:DUF3592 domain-containing protein [Paenibacillus kribbensis]ASR45536.1 hypothetical protein B4V02_01845 [Paenibacillus kribbensis]